MKFGQPSLIPRTRIFDDWPKDVGNTTLRSVEIYSLKYTASLSRRLESSATILLLERQMTQCLFKVSCVKESQWHFCLIWRTLNRARFGRKICVVGVDSIRHCEKKFIRKFVLTLIGYRNRTVRTAMVKTLWMIINKDKLIWCFFDRAS